MSKRMAKKRLAEIEEFYAGVSAGFMSVEVLRALQAECEYSGSVDLLLAGAKHRITELELAHDKALADGIEIVAGRDARIVELEECLRVNGFRPCDMPA